MAFKKLCNSESIALVLQESQGIFLFKYQDGNHLIALFEPDEQAIKSNKFADVQSFRYIGFQENFDAFAKQLPELASKKMERKKIVDKTCEIWCYPEQGKIVFAKEPIKLLDADTIRENSASTKHSLASTIAPKKESTVSTRNSMPKLAATKAKKKVLIIDDSKTIQKLLKGIVASSESLETMAALGHPREAIEFVKENTPDLITLDIHLPEMNGVELLKNHLRQLNIPVIMITSVSIKEGPLVMDALANGAIDYIQKPSLDQLDETRSQILEKLEQTVAAKTIAEETKQRIDEDKPVDRFRTTEGIIVIGSSTGGCQALEKILTKLPQNIPPILITQHIPAVFSKALADRLNTLCSFSVKEAEDGETVQANTAYIAKGGTHLQPLKRGNTIRLVHSDDPPVKRFKPSVDYMFRAIGKVNIKPLTAVMLTGMGNDGAASMRELHDAGANTIAQDEETSVVFGMPKSAIECGGVDKVAPLGSIAAEIALIHGAKKSKKAIA